MPPIVSSARRSRSGLRAAVAALSSILVIGLLAVVPVVAAPATPGPGYVDWVYKPLADGSGADDVTSFRNQSKLWFNDGRWWGILFDKGSTADGTYRIQSFNMATQTWSSGVTGAAVDNRNRSHADVLWDGTNLWVASSHERGSNVSPNGDLRVYKFSYSSASKTYALAGGFPIAVAHGVAGDGTYAATIAKAPNGLLWISYTQGNTVMVVHSTNTAGSAWTAPFALPGQGNPIVGDNDQAAIINLSNGVGVLWSNQTSGDEAFYFAGHKDGDADGTWGTRETAYGGSGQLGADGHISLKADGTGRIVAAVKTSVVASAAALIVVIARTGAADAAGSWSDHAVATHADGGTRPVLVLDSENNQANVFITDDNAGSGHYLITRRTAPLNTLNFGTHSIGSAFISSTANGSLNNGTSTKQVTSASSGVILLAENIPTRTYLHGCTGGPCPVVPVADFTGTPTSGQGPLSVQFTDTTTGTPATWAWDFGDGGTSAVQNPSHTFNPGDYTVSLTVTNAAGSDSVTKTNYIHVTVPPGATYTGIPPARMLNTRNGTGLSGKFVNHVPRSFQIAGQGSVPSNAIAITGNLTVADQSQRGFVFLGPTASSTPASSTINFPVGDSRANGVTVALDGDGKLAAVYLSPVSGATTNLILDVTGYFLDGTSDATYHGVAPNRVLNTRSGTGLSGKFTNHTVRTFTVTGGSVPSDAVAITGNLTVADQSQRGFVFVGPTASSNPASSTINFPVGDTRANNITVPLGASGTLQAVYVSPVSSASTNLILDVTGYFTNDTSGARYFPLSPNRVLNTRNGTGLSGKFFNHSVRTFNSTGGSSGVPSDAVAITGNLTVADQSQRGFVFVGPTASSTPASSTINFPVGDSRANGVAVQLGASGTLQAVYISPVSSASTNLLLDVTGYFK
jgi:PKD repeat protein